MFLLRSRVLGAVMATIEWAGVSFLTVARQDVERLRAGGLFAYVARDGGPARLLFVGEAEDIARAVGPHHEHWAPALAAGFNEIHVSLQPGARLDRLQLVSRIARALAPPLNGEAEAERATA
jgi:hypothetical protein